MSRPDPESSARLSRIASGASRISLEHSLEMGATHTVVVIMCRDPFGITASVASASSIDGDGPGAVATAAAYLSDLSKDHTNPNNN